MMSNERKFAGLFTTRSTGYLVIDPTNLGRLRFKLSPREPANDLEERGLHQGGGPFPQAASPIETASDGVKAFTGIITAIIAGDPEVITIDEPEAFLHPSLSFNLGKEIGRATNWLRETTC